MFKLELELTEEEKGLLNDAIWYQIATLAVLEDLGGLTSKERKELEMYKSIYKKLDNKLEDWVEKVVNIPIRIAEILYRLGLAVTHDADKHKIIIKRDK